MAKDIRLSQITQTSLATTTRQHHSAFGQHSLCGLATEVIRLVTQQKQINTLDDPKTLQQQLTTELHIFSQSAQQHHYTQESSLLAEYILARFVDATFEDTQWADQWHTYQLAHLKAYHTIHHRFDQALNAIHRMPQAFIDILELIYLCQSLTNNRALPTENNTRQLYQIIRNQRGEIDRKLSRPIPKIFRQQGIQQARFILYTAIATTAILIGGILLSFEVVLNTSSQPVQQKIQQLRQQ